MDGVTLRQRPRYEFDNTMSRGTGALVGWLVPEKSFGVLINPPNSARLAAAAGDRVIVLAEL